MGGNPHERLFTIAYDAGLQVHKELGPGLMESVYETILANRLARAGHKVERQKPVTIVVDGITLPDAYRVDLLIDGRLVVELKALEKIANLHIRQTLTYVRLLNQPLGILMNFGNETFAESTRRIMNNHFIGR